MILRGNKTYGFLTQQEIPFLFEKNSVTSRMAELTKILKRRNKRGKEEVNS